MIRGRKAALSHMLKTGLYPKEDVELMRQYSNVLCKISDTWVSGDPSLPAGWRIRKYNSKPTSRRVHCDFLSPENHVIRSRKGVLEHMRKTGGYTAHDFELVERAQNKPERRKTEDMEPRNSSHHSRSVYQPNNNPSSISGFQSSGGGGDGEWREAEFLPPGWRKRPADGCYMSPIGNVFWSMTEVVKELEERGGLTWTELAKIKRMVAQNSEMQQPQAHQHQVHLSHRLDTAGSVPSQPVAAAEADTSKGQMPRGWKLCPNIPKGWRMKTHYWGNREKHIFRSPEGKVFNSRKLAVDHMTVEGRIPPEELERFRQGPRKRKRSAGSWVNGRRKPKVREAAKKCLKNFSGPATKRGGGGQGPGH